MSIQLTDRRWHRTATHNGSVDLGTDKASIATEWRQGLSRVLFYHMA